MKHIHILMTVLLILVSLMFSACAPKPKSSESTKPVVLEKIDGSDLNRVMLTEKAAARLDIQTAPVTVEHVKKVRILVGEVVGSPNIPVSGGEKPKVDLSGEAYVRLNLNESDRKIIDHTQPVRIITNYQDDENGDDADENDLEGDPFEDSELEDNGDEEQATLYYKFDNAGHNLTEGQNVWVEVSLGGNGDSQKVIPYAALLYDLNGKTFVYVSPEPLVFFQHPVTVEFIDGDKAILLEGPDEGTQVVTVGVAELYGADTGVGK